MSAAGLLPPAITLRAIVLLAFAAGLCGPAARNASAADPVTADILLKGGEIYDGTGDEAVLGDIAIKGERIVAVGEFEVEQASFVVDCSGLIIAPGFIDLHNHSDSQMVDRLQRANVNYLLQGCTTVVTGNCGAGPIDVGEYYFQINAVGAGTNVAHLIPHGSLREAVLGTVERPAVIEEMIRMKQLISKAMRNGAWGMSTGLIYVPGAYADTTELVELAKVVSVHGGIYASHIRNEGTELLASVEEALKIGREAGLPVHISHLKSSGQEAWGLVLRAAEMVEKARQAGQRVTADQYPYIASSTSLEAVLIPTWARAGGRDDLVARFDDPSQMQRIRDAMQVNLKKRNGGDALRIARYAPRRDWVGKSLAAIARDERSDALDIAIEITRHGGASVVSFGMSEEDVRDVMKLPWVATASDGRSSLPGPDKPHPRNNGTFPRKIGYYSIREKVLPLELAIRSASGLPADILGMQDRGYLKPGMYADVTVFDAKTFIDTATFDEPHRYAEGVRYVFVNGVPAVYSGRPTGTLAGRALRRPENNR